MQKAGGAYRTWHQFKKPGRPSIGWRRGGGGGGGGGTISAEGGQYLLADYVRGGQFPLADCVRGDKICGGTESAPTPVLAMCSLCSERDGCSAINDAGTNSKVRVYTAPMVLERIATVSTPITAHGCTLYTICCGAFAQVCLYLTLNDS